jgi:hypothetical protein
MPTSALKPGAHVTFKGLPYTVLDMDYDRRGEPTGDVVLRGRSGAVRLAGANDCKYNDNKEQHGHAE